MKFLLLALAFAGCAPKSAPRVFRTELLPLEEPELGEIPAPTEDAAPVASALKPGQAPPYVDPKTCKATHRAQVVPEDQVAELVQDQERAEFWRDRAGVERRGREFDRSYCETVAVPLFEESQHLRQENRALRWAAPVALVVGIFVGAMAGSAGETLGGR